MADRYQPVYLISVVAKLLEVHPQTLRMYERQGFIRPSRRGHIRLYCDADIERLQQIQRFKEEMGVNLAGIEVILHMLDRMEEMQKEVDEIRERAKRRLTKLTEDR